MKKASDNNINMPEWVQGFISDAYQSDVNPLPVLREMFPLFVWKFSEYRGDSVPENPSSAARLSDVLSATNADFYVDGIGDDLAVAAYVVTAHYIPNEQDEE